MGPHLSLLPAAQEGAGAAWGEGLPPGHIPGGLVESLQLWRSLVLSGLVRTVLLGD